MTTEQCSYEEARKKRVLENLKHLEDLGISKISKSLLEVAKCEYKLLKTHTSPRSRKKFEITEVRRSSRARNPAPSYRDEVDDIDLRSYRKRYCRSDQSGREYTGRIASYEEQVCAVKKAEEFQSRLDLNNPSFVKTMVRSHVSSCFWLVSCRSCMENEILIYSNNKTKNLCLWVIMLPCHKGLPSKFCKQHLPSKEMKMVLEDENGLEFDAIYIGNRTGLSGGWRGFAMEHNLEDGDSLVFELIQPDRFKIYILKAINSEVEDSDDQIADMDTKQTAESAKAEGSDGANSPVSQTPPGSFRKAQRDRKRRR